MGRARFAPVRAWISKHRREAQIALAVGGVGCLGVSVAPVDWFAEAPRAWALTAGFALLTGATALSIRRAVIPFFIALVFFLYGGLSATFAVPDLEVSAKTAKTLTEDEKKASQPVADYVDPGVGSFRYAALVTALGGLAAIGGAVAVARYGGSATRRLDADPGTIERIGRLMVAVGFGGVALSLLRFALTELPSEDLFASMKSFWEGGTYFLLVATFAIPGFAFWLQGALERNASRRELLRIGVVATVYLGLLVPTGQRGFALALAIILMVILIFDGRLSARNFALILVGGVVLIGASQAARNQIRETDGLSPGGYVSRLAPGEWKVLFGSQLASYNWTVVVAANRENLDVPNPLLGALLKPVPRQIYPDKSQGFSAEFTKRLYPEASAQSISFATPLVAEADFSFGPIGVLLIFAGLGISAATAERFLSRRASRIVEPIVLATVGWCIFLLVRGDFVNAAVFSSGWVIPLAIASKPLGIRAGRRRARKRIVIDALQISPDFSGIGRRVREIGDSIAEGEPPAYPLVVRCAEDTVGALRPYFPATTTWHSPLRSGRPRSVRVLYQQLIAPILDGRGTLLVCPGDQAPVWGRAKLLFIVHDIRRLTHPETSASALERAYYSFVTKRGVRRAQRILTISEFSRGEIERVLEPRCPVIVVPAHPRPRELAAKPTAVPTFLTVGALRSYKGLTTVIDALARLREQGNGSVPRVLCVGGGEGRDEHRSELAEYAAEAGVSDLFELTGWVPDAELDALYATATATINPSTYEGYGLPVAESIAGGIPTIASDIPPHREIADGAAVYFEPGDPDSLADAISRVGADAALRERLASSARRRSQELAGAGPTWGKAILAASEDTLGPLG